MKSATQRKSRGKRVSQRTGRPREDGPRITPTLVTRADVREYVNANALSAASFLVGVYTCKYDPDEIKPYQVAAACKILDKVVPNLRQVQVAGDTVQIKPRVVFTIGGEESAAVEKTETSPVNQDRQPMP